MRNYKVECYFEGYNEPEVSYHFDCDRSDEAISEAMENLEGVWVDQIKHIDFWEL